MSYIPLTFAPDQDTSWESLPGGLQGAINFVPTARGTLATWACENTIASHTSTTEPQIGYILRKNDGSARFFLCNKQSVVEYTSTSAVTDRSGTTYSASTETWTAATFGDTQIFTNLLDPVQKSTTGALSDLGGSPPKAQLVAVNLGFVMLANINDGTAKTNGWFCSDIEDPEDWTITATNQADSGTLYDTPGPIRALTTLRDTFVAFKDDSIYVAEYVGDPNTTIWAWRLISDKVGCSAPHGVCLFNDKLYFLHRTGFYVFDGAAVRQIGREISNTIFARSAATSTTNFARIQTTVDLVDGTIFFCLADANRKLSDIWAYNANSNKWGGYLEPNAFTISGSNDYATCIVRATQSDIVAFASGEATNNPRTALFAGPISASVVGVCRAEYPAQGTSRTAQLITGPIGEGDRIQRITGVDVKFLSLTINSGTPTPKIKTGKSAMALFNTTGDTTGTWNTTEFRADFSGSGTSNRYAIIDFSMTAQTGEIAGLRVNYENTKPAGRT